MREIKFRAWDKKCKIMLVGEHVKVRLFAGSAEVESAYGRGDTDSTDKWDKNDYILMQYTGLKDKNGKGIYEGDVVEYKSAMWRKEQIARVLFGRYFHQNEGGYNGVDCLGFFLADEEGDCIFCDDGWDKDAGIEVVGNIYENPELLDKKED